MILRKILQEGDKTLIQKVIDLNLVPVLIQLMGDINEPHLVLESSWCVVNLALGDYKQVESMISNGLYQATHKVICNPHEKIFEQGAWIIANVSSEDERHKKEFLNLGCHFPMMEKLQSGHPVNDKKVIEYSLWSLSNLCRGVEYFAKEACIPLFVKILLTQSDPEMLSNALLPLADLMNDTLMNNLIQHNILKRIKEIASL